MEGEMDREITILGLFRKAWLVRAALRRGLLAGEQQTQSIRLNTAQGRKHVEGGGTDIEIVGHGRMLGFNGSHRVLPLVSS